MQKRKEVLKNRQLKKEIWTYFDLLLNLLLSTFIHNSSLTSFITFCLKFRKWIFSLKIWARSSYLLEFSHLLFSINFAINFIVFFNPLHSFLFFILLLKIIKDALDCKNLRRLLKNLVLRRIKMLIGPICLPNKILLCWRTLKHTKLQLKILKNQLLVRKLFMNSWSWLSFTTKVWKAEKLSFIVYSINYCYQHNKINSS